MLVPEDRVAFFDVVVALVRRVVSGGVTTGYFGLRGGEGEGEDEVSFFFGGVDDRFMRTNRNKKRKKRKKKRKKRRKKRMTMRTRKGM